MTNSKQFAWDIVGEQMIENLLNKHNRCITFPTKDEDGDISYRGLKFTVKEMKM